MAEAVVCIVHFFLFWCCAFLLLFWWGWAPSDLQIVYEHNSVLFIIVTVCSNKTEAFVIKRCGWVTSFIILNCLPRINVNIILYLCKNLYFLPGILVMCLSQRYIIKWQSSGMSHVWQCVINVLHKPSTSISKEKMEINRIYPSTGLWHPILEDSNLYSHQSENPKSEHQHTATWRQQIWLVVWSHWKP